MKAPHATTIATLLAVCITKVYGKRTIRRGLDEGSMSMFMPEFAKGKSGSSSKSGKACPDEADNSCLSDTRKASLLAKFGIQITNNNATGYDKLSDVFIKVKDLLHQKVKVLLLMHSKNSRSTPVVDYVVSFT